MKYIVTHRFKDKYTGAIYVPGMSFASDEDGRIKDLIDRVLIKEVENIVETDLEELTNKELKVKLDEKGIEYEARANKKTLVALLGGE